MNLNVSTGKSVQFNFGKTIDIDKGIAYAQRSLELDPDQNPARAMDTLALGYIKQDRHAEAVELLKQALDKAPDNETLLVRLQQAKERLEDESGVTEEPLEQLRNE